MRRREEENVSAGGCPESHLPWEQHTEDSEHALSLVAQRSASTAPLEDLADLLVTLALSLRLKRSISKSTLRRRWGQGAEQCQPKARGRFAFPGARNHRI